LWSGKDDGTGMLWDEEDRTGWWGEEEDGTELWGEEEDGTRLWGVEEDGTVSELCPMAGFVVTGIKSFGSLLIIYVQKLEYELYVMNIEFRRMWDLFYLTPEVTAETPDDRSRHSVSRSGIWTEYLQNLCNSIYCPLEFSLRYYLSLYVTDRKLDYIVPND
jgi:hypothetical protein